MSPTRHPGVRLGVIGAAVVTVGALTTFVGTLRGWVASGERHRNSYDILALIGRLGFAPDGPLELALRAWPLVPLLLVGAMVAAWWRRPVITTACGVAAALYAGGVGAVVSTGPGDGVVRVLDGPVTTVLGAIVVVVGVVLVVAAGISRALGREDATRPDSGAPVSVERAGR